jgi:putative hydrolase of the HAD superfamily
VSVRLSAVDAVTFDLWDTLLVAEVRGAYDTRRVACAEVLAARGYQVDEQRLEAALATGLEAYRASWHANSQFGLPHLADHCLRTLELPTATDLREGLVTAMLEDAAARATTCSPNIESTLGELNRAGLRLGIICDVGMTPSRVLREHLRGHGLLRWFSHWSFSDEVGFYKPSPEIFEHAMAGLEVSDPRRVCHVGDLRRTDVTGARAAGWRSVRYAGLNDDTDAGLEADHVVYDHAELVHVLT